MYVSSPPVRESAIEDDGTKNKKQSRVRNLENKILQNIFSAKLCKQNKCTMLSKEEKKIKKIGVSILTFIMSTKPDFQLLVSKTARVNVLPKCCQNHKAFSFPLI